MSRLPCRSRVKNVSVTISVAFPCQRAWLGVFETCLTELESPETKKRLCPHTWDKSVNFCDTTQIDICENVHSLTRTIIRAPMDNGWGPVSPY